VSRSRVIVSKLIVALFFPLLLVLATLLGSLVAGIPHGYGEFRGGTGLGPGLFQGVGVLSPSAALAEVLRGGLLTWIMLMPVAALSLFYGVLLLSTSAAALATLATLSVLRLLVVFPEGLHAGLQPDGDFCLRPPRPLIPIAVKSLNVSDETRAEREAKETCCGRWTEIQFFPGFQGIGRSTSKQGNEEEGPAISLTGPSF